MRTLNRCAWPAVTHSHNWLLPRADETPSPRAGRLAKGGAWRAVPARLPAGPPSPAGSASASQRPCLSLKQLMGGGRSSRLQGPGPAEAGGRARLAGQGEKVGEVGRLACRRNAPVPVSTPTKFSGFRQLVSLYCFPGPHGLKARTRSAFIPSSSETTTSCQCWSLCPEDERVDGAGQPSRAAAAGGLPPRRRRSAAGGSALMWKITALRDSPRLLAVRDRA